MAGRKKQKLDPRKSIFISEILTGKNGAAAARAAGIEKKNASRQAHRWQNDPAIAEEIEQGLAAIRQDAEVTCESMIRQLDADRQFAIKTENASAATRASELKAKLVGLMIDRRDVRAAHIVKAEDHSTRDVALAISDETCTGTKALCRISLSCPANKCMEDLNLDGVWGCVTCSTPGGSPTDKKENSSPPDGKKKKTR